MYAEDRFLNKIAHAFETHYSEPIGHQISDSLHPNGSLCPNQV